MFIEVTVVDGNLYHGTELINSDYILRVEDDLNNAGCSKIYIKEFKNSISKITVRNSYEDIREALDAIQCKGQRTESVQY